MTTTPIDNTSITTDFNVDELTEGTLTGKGVFDVLLQTLRLHLDREFNSGRITGTAYATVYSQAITAFLAQAAQYAINKAKLPLELQLVQEQINLTQKQQNKLSYEIEEVLQRINEVTPSQIALSNAQKAKVQGEVVQLEAQTAILGYELTNIKPAEKDNLVSIGLRTDAETAQVVYKTTNLLPEELEILKRNQIQLTAQTGEINYRVSTLLPSQTAQNTAQTAQITYTTSYVLPSQVSLTNAQTDSATAQTALYDQKTVTELAQTTTTPASGSVMGVQNDLMATQKASYLRDAEQKAAKMLIDTWNVRHNGDPTGNPVSATNRLRNDDIGDAVGKMLTGIGVV